MCISFVTDCVRAAASQLLLESLHLKCRASQIGNTASGEYFLPWDAKILQGDLCSRKLGSFHPLLDTINVRGSFDSWQKTDSPNPKPKQMAETEDTKTSLETGAKTQGRGRQHSSSSEMAPRRGNLFRWEMPPPRSVFCMQQAPLEEYFSEDELGPKP